jgi:hypothetical protein
MPPAKKPRAPKAEPPPQPPPPRRGRPDTGVRSGYKRVEIAFPPPVYEAIARLADRRQMETGRTTRRADIIREAVVAYLREHLPEAGI